MATTTDAGTEIDRSVYVLAEVLSMMPVEKFTGTQDLAYLTVNMRLVDVLSTFKANMWCLVYDGTIWTVQKDEIEISFDAKSSKTVLTYRK